MRRLTTGIDSKIVSKAWPALKMNDLASVREGCTGCTGM